MAHPIVYGEKDLTLTSPTIQVNVETSAGFTVNGNMTTPTVYGKVVASPQFVTISPAGIMGSEAIPPSGVLTVGAVDTNPNANAAKITGTQLQLEPANISFPGVVTTGNQSFAGTKVFTGPISSTSSIGVGTTLNDSAGDVLLSYTGTTNPQSITVGSAITTQLNANGIYGNSPGSPQQVIISSTGVLGSQAIPAAVSIATFGSSPTANAATVSSNAITFQPADATHPGSIALGTQTIPGTKTFANQTTFTNGLILGPTFPYVQHSSGSNLLTNVFDPTSIYVGPAVGSNTLGNGTSQNNTGIGNGALNNLTSGTHCIGVGQNAGNNYTGTESNDICIGNLGTVAESGVTNIGTQGTHTVCKIAGISGVSPASPQMVTIGTANQLGSQAIPAAVSFNAVGASPSANGATVASNAITLEPADATHPGLISTAAQTMGSGAKTFSSTAVFSAGLTLPTGQQILDNNGNTLIWKGPINDSSTVYIGTGSGAAATNATGNNIGIGNGALNACTAGIRSVAVGVNALHSWLGTGSVGYNTCIGFSSGSAYTGTETGNIIINNSSTTLGTVGENSVIRIGQPGSTSCFIAGITGVTSAGAVAAVINGSGQLGTVISSKKYKQDIMDIETNPIMQLQAIQYKEIVNPKEIQYGFLAEQVLPILPEAIIFEKVKDKDGNIMYDSRGQMLFSETDPETIQYHKLWPLLQDYVKKMDQRLKQVEVELEEFRGAPLKRCRREEDSNRPTKRTKTI